MAWLVFTIFGSDADAARKQGELSFAVLSALKQGLEGGTETPLRLLLLCDARNRRPDLPLDHLIHSQDPGLFARLDLVARHCDAPFVMVDTASDFKAPPALLFRHLSTAPLVQARMGLLSSQPDFAAFCDRLDRPPAPDAPAFDLCVFGLDPRSKIITKSIKIGSQRESDPSKISNLEHLQLTQEISTFGTPTVAEDTVRTYLGPAHPIRHVYHGLQRSMFPAGQPVNCNLAARLPTVAMPPVPFALRLRAKLGGLIRGFGMGTEAGYRAYLCACAAPTAQGRDVWANIALDHLEGSRTAGDKLQRALPRLAPAALAGADLHPDTKARWQAFWAR